MVFPQFVGLIESQHLSATLYRGLFPDGEAIAHISHELLAPVPERLRSSLVNTSTARFAGVSEIAAPIVVSLVCLKNSPLKEI